MKDNLQAINKNTQQLNECAKEVEHVLKFLRDDFEEFRDRSFAALSVSSIDQGSWIMLRLGQLSGKLNGYMEELQCHGVMPRKEQA